MKQPKSTSASKKKIESLILVTEKNRQHCIVLGRICHVYQKSTTAFTSMGSFDIRPRITAFFGINAAANFSFEISNSLSNVIFIISGRI